MHIWSASTHRLTTNRASISISVARSGRGAERLRVIGTAGRAAHRAWTLMMVALMPRGLIGGLVLSH